MEELAGLEQLVATANHTSVVPTSETGNDHTEYHTVANTRFSDMRTEKELFNTSNYPTDCYPLCLNNDLWGTTSD